jgi:hypothetical protein
VFLGWLATTIAAVEVLVLAGNDLTTEFQAALDADIDADALLGGHDDTHDSA